MRLRQSIAPVAATLALAGCFLPGLPSSNAQQGQQRAAPPQPAQPQPAGPRPPATPSPQMPREQLQADISTRRVAVTSSFTGIEIVVFGAVDHSRQPSADSGYYDVVVLVEGTPTRLTARKKDRIAGLWLNADSLRFESVPSYYAIASTKPLGDIASPEVLKAAGIGFDYVPMKLGKGAETRSAAEIKDYRDAIVRLKRKEKLYSEASNDGVTFIGRSLFRASVDLPANVTVGPFDTRVYLFREGELLSKYSARINLERAGVEQYIYEAAVSNPLVYGLVTVMLAMSAGLLATTIFRRPGG